jgi:LysR family glycine cleavage system transcriptional activator
MARKLPPLNALRAFEAAARHLSFTRAADELFVTQAAVSHQVKTLEEHLGIKLFRRLNRALMLTDEGQKYFPDVRDALDQLAQATKSLHKSDTSGVMTLSVMPSFASLWLVPRLQNFTTAYPDIDLRISADDKIVDFNQDDVECAIRYGLGKWPNSCPKPFSQSAPPYIWKSTPP